MGEMLFLDRADIFPAGTLPGTKRASKRKACRQHKLDLGADSLRRWRPEGSYIRAHIRFQQVAILTWLTYIALPTLIVVAMLGFEPLHD